MIGDRPRTRRPVLPRGGVLEKHFNLLLAAVVVVGLGAGAFLASLQSAQAGGGQTPSAAQRSSVPGQTQGGSTLANPATSSASSPGAVAGQTGDARSRLVMGSVASVDGDTLTITTQQGDTKVKLGGAKLEKTVAGSVEDLRPDQRVMLVAQQGQEGGYTASSVQILGAGTPQAMAGQLRGAGQGQPQGQGQGQAGADARGRPLVGSVVSLEGDTLTLSPQQQGESNLKVKLGGAPIQKTVEATSADLKPGVRVVVTGQQGSDGSLTATEVQILAEGQTPVLGGAPVVR